MKREEIIEKLEAGKVGAEEAVRLLQEVAAAGDGQALVEPDEGGRRMALITDTHRGVYVGRVTDKDIFDVRDGAAGIEVKDLRMVYYWIAGGGLFDLAITGPQKGSKVSKPVQYADVRDISKIITLTKAADGAFARCGWGTWDD